jgi:hypothetical protein
LQGFLEASSDHYQGLRTTYTVGMGKERTTSTLDRIKAVEFATESARRTRNNWRRRGGRNDMIRVNALRAAIGGINEAQGALRSDLGRMSWNLALERTHGERARRASAEAQAERRKLRKMLPREGR